VGIPSGYRNGAAAPTDVLSEKAGFAPQTADQDAIMSKIALHFGNNIFSGKPRNKPIPLWGLRFFDIQGTHDHQIVSASRTNLPDAPFSECGLFMIYPCAAFVRDPDPIAGSIGDCIR
jgi:hypothetical protein